MLDLKFEAHNQRQKNAVKAEYLKKALHEIVDGHKFYFEKDGWQARPYPGIAFLAMLGQDQRNYPAVEGLKKIQSFLIHTLSKEGLVYPLPPSSFHQTIANLLSADRYQNRVIATGKKEELKENLKGAVVAKPSIAKAVQIRIIGMSVFKTALGALGIVDDPGDYNRIIQFREHVYFDEKVNNFGIHRTRPFMSHITLAYFHKQLPEDRHNQLYQSLIAVNQQLINHPIDFLITGVELKNYQNLSAFDSFDPKIEIAI